jgi:hypothetical protein
MSRAELMRNLSRVDWIRVGQRLCTFAREMRGDGADVITAETQREIARSQRLRTTIESFAESIGVKGES